MKKLFTKIKCGMNAKAQERLAKHAKQEEHQRMAGNVFTARIKAQKEADALRRAAKGTTGKSRSILD